MNVKSIILLGFLLSDSACAQSTCQAGTDNEEGGESLSMTDFVFNTGEPAQCNGTVTAWNFCYYTNDDEDSEDTYEFTIAMYRPTPWPQPGVEWLLVEKSNRTITLSSAEVQRDIGLVCTQFLLVEDDRFDAQEGDVISACVQNRDRSRRALPVFTEIADSSRRRKRQQSPSLQIYDRGRLTSECIQDRVICDRDLNDPINGFILHLFAEISINPLDPTELATTQDPQEIATNQQMPTDLTENTQTIATTTMTNDEQPTQENSSSTAVIAIVVVIFIVLITLLAIGTTVIVVVLVKRHKKAEKLTYSISKSDDIPLHTFENKTYDDVSDNNVGAEALYHILEAPSTRTSEVPSQHIYEAITTTNGYEKLHHPICDHEHIGQHNPSEYVLLQHTVPKPHLYSILEPATIGYSQLLKENQETDIYANVASFLRPASNEDGLYAQIQYFGITTIHQEYIESLHHLGSGQFGSVDQGVWRKPNDSAVDVALKTLKEGSSEQDKVRFLQEGAIVAQFKHPNIVSLYGIVCRDGPVTLVFELVTSGNLREYLQSLIPISQNTATQLLKFSQQVALGMQYLTSKGFVHRDLAARNILVSSDNICKIADFGMSRDLADEQYYVSHGGKIPVKWTAPEALHFKKYSTASDVWSYGCLLYEIWSIGQKPFEEKQNVAVLRLIETGYRLPPPPGCPRRVYELMIAAWHPAPSSRPGFRDLLLALMMNEEEVLCVPSGHEEGSQATILGAPLKEGEALYPNLQKKYC